MYNRCLKHSSARCEQDGRRATAEDAHRPSGGVGPSYKQCNPMGQGQGKKVGVAGNRRNAPQASTENTSPGT